MKNNILRKLSVCLIITLLFGNGCSAKMDPVEKEESLVENVSGNQSITENVSDETEDASSDISSTTSVFVSSNGKAQTEKTSSILSSGNAVSTSSYPPTPAGQTYVPSDGNVLQVNEDTVTVYGRHHEKDGALAFCNSSTGIGFAFYGSALAVELDSTSFAANLESYATVYVDDREPVVVKITEARYYTVAKNLNEKTVHNVRILKRSEANQGEMLIRSLKISAGGKFYTAVQNTSGRKIQVLGDSITCGVGNLYVSGDATQSLDYEDGCQTYATMLAEQFHAELDLVAISGIGVGNSQNQPWPLLPVYKKADNSSNISFDFESFVPDVVIISLGTNDDACGNTGDEFYANACEYIYTIRENYPKAYILWTYGVMSQNNINNIRKVIIDLKALGDDRLYFVPLDKPSGDELPLGLYGHPSLKTHQRMASVLANQIKQLTGW